MDEARAEHQWHAAHSLECVSVLGCVSYLTLCAQERWKRGRMEREKGIWITYWKYLDDVINHSFVVDGRMSETNEEI